MVLFRGRDTGVVHAAPRHCEHQGVDLVHGDVVGDCLRCPLHHWEYGDRSAPFRAAERFGMLFVHVGGEPQNPVPGFSLDDDQLHVRSGRPVDVDCPWYAAIANAFDMTHLETVHRRKLTSDVVVTYPDPMTFAVEYATSVTGGGWSDRMMRALSGDDIRVRIRVTGGTMLLVESAIGRFRSFLLTSLRPTANGVSILPIFGVPRSRTGMHRVAARIAAALFTAFLLRDVRPLSGIRLPHPLLDPHDPTITACYRYLCGLPEFIDEERS